MLAFLDVFLKSMTENGFIMAPFVALVFLWIGAIVTEFYGKPLCRHPMAYLIFPMGFLVLFSFRISMFFLTVYQNHAARRGVDYDTQVDDGMMLARSLIVIGSAAALSLLSAVVVMFCRGEKRRTKPGV